MDKFIDAERLERHFECCIDEVRNTGGVTEDFEIALKATKNQPAADVQEVRHGKWIYTAFYGCNLATVKCSRCDYQCTTTKDIAVEICDFNYCSECGAKMDGEE